MGVRKGGKEEEKEAGSLEVDGEQGTSQRESHNLIIV